MVTWNVIIVGQAFRVKAKVAVRIARGTAQPAGNGTHPAFAIIGAMVAHRKKEPSGSFLIRDYCSVATFLEYTLLFKK